MAASSSGTRSGGALASRLSSTPTSDRSGVTAASSSAASRVAESSSSDATALPAPGACVSARIRAAAVRSAGGFALPSQLRASGTVSMSPRRVSETAAAARTSGEPRRTMSRSVSNAR